MTIYHCFTTSLPWHHHISKIIKDLEERKRNHLKGLFISSWRKQEPECRFIGIVFLSFHFLPKICDGRVPSLGQGWDVYWVHTCAKLASS